MRRDAGIGTGSGIGAGSALSKGEAGAEVLRAQMADPTTAVLAASLAESVPTGSDPAISKGDAFGGAGGNPDVCATLRLSRNGEGRPPATSKGECNSPAG